MNVPKHKPRPRSAIALAIVLVVAAACAGRQTQPPRVFGPMRGEAAPPGDDPNGDPEDDEDSCTADVDCVMTNFTDCCACCECTKPPYAIVHKKLHQLEARCADTDCALDGCNTKRCPPCTPPSTKAVCDEGSCVER